MFTGVNVPGYYQLRKKNQALSEYCTRVIYQTVQGKSEYVLLSHLAYCQRNVQSKVLLFQVTLA
jgi:hypothetical protein